MNSILDISEKVVFLSQVMKSVSRSGVILLLLCRNLVGMEL